MRKYGYILKQIQKIGIRIVFIWIRILDKLSKIGFREGQDPPLQKGSSRVYLSIGNDMAVRDKSIIGIFDLDNTSTSRRTREFLDKAEKDGEVVPCDDLPKSFVLTSEYGFSRVRLTALNTATLEKRLK